MGINAEKTTKYFTKFTKNDSIWVYLNKGKLVERRGRKAMGLRPQGYDSQVAERAEFNFKPA